MIVLYDATGEARPLSAYENFSITHKLDGCDEMTFYVDTIMSSTRCCMRRLASLQMRMNGSSRKSTTIK